MISVSSSIDFYVATNPSKLESNDVRIIRVNGGAMRWLESDLSRCLETIAGCRIDYPPLAAWAELDPLPKRVRTSRRILKQGTSIWRERRSTNAVLRSIECDTWPQIESGARA